MTEAEWNSSIEPKGMLESLRALASERKLRLFMFASCRQILTKIQGDGKASLAITTRLANGLETEDNRSALVHSLLAILGADSICTPDGDCVGYGVDGLDDRWAVILAFLPNQMFLCDRGSGRMIVGQESRWWDIFSRAAVVCDLPGRWRHVETYESTSAFLRDIFGNPFRPVAFDPRWRSADVVGLAAAI